MLNILFSEAQLLCCRDGVLGPPESLCPCGGKMSSSLQPSTLTTIDTAAAATNSSPAIATAGVSASHSVTSSVFYDTGASSLITPSAVVSSAGKLEKQLIDNLKSATSSSLVSKGYVTEASPLVVPSTCWDSGRLVKYGGATAIASMEARPPVLGEEEKIGLEENLMSEQQDSLMLGSYFSIACFLTIAFYSCIDIFF